MPLDTRAPGRALRRATGASRDREPPLRAFGRSLAARPSRGRPSAWPASPARGLLAGLAAGLVGTLAMTAFQSSWQRASQRRGPARPRSEERAGHRGSGAAEHRGRQGGDGSRDPSTVRTADAGARWLLGRSLLPAEKSAAGSLVHYGFGSGMGAVYGALAERAPVATLGHGTAFALALMLAADDLALPALGLAPSPRRQPVSAHLYALGAHLVYGLVMESVRRGVRARLR